MSDDNQELEDFNPQVQILHQSASDGEDNDFIFDKNSSPFNLQGVPASKGQAYNASNYAGERSLHSSSKMMDTSQKNPILDSERSKNFADRSGVDVSPIPKVTQTIEDMPDMLNKRHETDVDKSPINEIDMMACSDV